MWEAAWALIRLVSGSLFEAAQPISAVYSTEIGNRKRIFPFVRGFLDPYQVLAIDSGFCRMLWYAIWRRI
jgi:hypothetical protein